MNVINMLNISISVKEMHRPGRQKKLSSIMGESFQSLYLRRLKVVKKKYSFLAIYSLHKCFPYEEINSCALVRMFSYKIKITVTCSKRYLILSSVAQHNCRVANIFITAVNKNIYVRGGSKINKL